MTAEFRVASFNVENLFRRVKVFTLDNPSLGDGILSEIGKLQEELNETTYNKSRILNLFNRVKDYISIRVDRGKFWRGRGFNAISADGRSNWDGSIVFKKAAFSRTVRYNTARIIREVKANLLCLIEVEDKPTLTTFNAHLLNYKYPYNLAIDGNDPRGIDVGLYSKNALGTICTHMYDRSNGKRIFSRDCLEVEIILPGGQSLYILCNHFKSKGYGTTATSDAKRKLQAQRVADIIGSKYQLDRDMVIVAGDLNDTPDSDALAPLMEINGLKDVLRMQFPQSPEQRWTYHYRRNEQIDYILISQPLQEAFLGAGVLRKGIYNLSEFTDGAENSFDSVTSPANQASDHGAVYVDFRL
jgi:endonuclease/exonuclease/phosphatase family metal-dependent hydrolase